MYHKIWGLVVLGLALGCGDGAPSPRLVNLSSSDAPTVEFNVPDMMCAEGCGTKVHELLSEQPGAKEVRVDFDSKSASVAVEEGQFDASAALADLVDHGFDNSSLKSDADLTAAPGSNEPK